MSDNSQKTFPMVAKTFQGLEDVLRDELLALGAKNVEIGTRMVSFEGDNAMMYRANLCCRTALRILKPIVSFTADNTDELYDFVRDYDWEQYLTVDSTFSIDSTVNSSEFTHSKFVTYRVKDGIADHFNDKYGRRPSIRLTGADLMLNVHIAERRVTISLDSSGDPLNQRGYRTETGAAPINEVLAAGIILKTGWRGDTDFVDPMCGSGTFLIEAALIAANINPGIYREGFAFERWPDFDAELFEEIYNDDSEERDFNHKIYGGDIDPEAVMIARKNIENAQVSQMVDLRCMPFQDWAELPGEPGILITNPPYNERLKSENIEELYRAIGTELKTRFQGWHAWIIGYKDEHFDAIRLKPSVRFPLLNGSLECSLREYVLFDGRYDDFKTGGGTVHNDTFNREIKRTAFKGQKPFRDDDRGPKKDFGKKDFGKKDRDFKGPKKFRDDDRGPKKFRDDDRKKDRDFKPKRREDGFRPKRREDDYKPRRREEDYKRVEGKGPRLSENSTVFKTEAKMRSRKRRDFEED